VFLIDIDGGFKWINKRIRLEKTWTITKITVGVINALAIIIIGIYSLFLSNSINILKKENEALKKELEQLNSQQTLTKPENPY